MKYFLFLFIFFIVACGSSNKSTVDPSPEEDSIRFNNLFSPFIYYPIESAPEAVSIGDVNNDGKNDVIMTTSDGYYSSIDDYMLLVYLQGSDGISNTPVKYSTQVHWEPNANHASRLSSIAIGDINNDGRNDVMIGHSGDSIEIFIQNQNSSLIPYQNITTENSDKVKSADLNNDNMLDLVGIGPGNNEVEILYQDSNNDFSNRITLSIDHGGYDELMIRDLNNDNFEDIIIMSGQLYLPNIGIIYSNKNGFDPPVYYSVGDNTLTNGSAVGDLNNDGLIDIAVTYGANQESYVGIFYQNQFSNFDSITEYSSNLSGHPMSIDIIDLNLDGKNDIIVYHRSRSIIETYLYKEIGLFVREIYSIPINQNVNPEAIYTGDLNSDGFPDIAIATDNGLTILYQ